MPPKDPGEEWSSLGIPKIPGDAVRLGSFSWLKNKASIDGAEGLWRIHDDLYDFKNFIDNHPGGPDWLTLTKGTDITEAFEVHHISTIPEQMLQKYHVRKAKTKRAVPFTFKDDGFYRTLKREIRPILKNLPKQPVKTSEFFIDTLLGATFLFAVISNYYWNFWLATLAGVLLCFTTIAAHNYFHQKDNFRMYYFNLSLLMVKNWRVSHALSHHLHTNTINDLEMYLTEPFVNYFPVIKSSMLTWGATIYSPFLGFLAFPVHFIFRYVLEMVRFDWKYFALPDLLVPLSLPTIMYMFGGHSLLSTVAIWLYMVSIAGFLFNMIGFNAAHHHPDIFHDGDAPRSTEDIDWGISQLDAVMDRVDITGSHFLVLTNFGDHALHHMFPTLDHGTLEYLYPTFNKVLKQFNIDLRMNSQLELIKGQFNQLRRTKPNKNPPNLNKKYL